MKSLIGLLSERKRNCVDSNYLKYNPFALNRCRFREYYCATDGVDVVVSAGVSGVAGVSTGVCFSTVVSAGCVGATVSMGATVDRLD